MNIIGDLEGQFDALIRLLERMPNDPIVLLGDLNDRGPQSKEVVEWAMSTSNVQTLSSNHQDLLVDVWMRTFEPDYVPRYDPYLFPANSGFDTLRSYGATQEMNSIEALRLIPATHIQWLATRPTIIEIEDLLLTHAPIPPDIELETAKSIQKENDGSLIWNRNEPSRRNRFQVFGHNSHWGLSWIEDYAVCLDTSKQNVLTGLHWPSRRVYQVPT